jgi:signal transduction histidine kinase
MRLAPSRLSKLIGDAAFAVLVVAAFTQFVFTRRIYGEVWQVAATFLIGAVHAVLGVFGNDTHCPRPRGRVHLYYLVQCLLVSAALLLSPVQGIFFLLAMPLVSETVFDYDWRGSAVITVFLFAVSVGAVWRLWGAEGAMQAAAGYFPAFLFTLLTTMITRAARADKSRAEATSTELAVANQHLREHAAQAEELATTRERNRLAREIHDGVGHYLTVIKVQLDAASALLPSDPARAAESVAKAARLAGEALDDVRRSVGTLAADAARPPLADTLRALTADSPPEIELKIEGPSRPLGASAEHALYRTAQEGLTNIRKHAGATRVVLTLDYRDPRHVRLSLRDNGRGAPAKHTGASAASGGNGGFGLRGLRERIALLGGKLDAGNDPAGGFALTAEVPA